MAIIKTLLLVIVLVYFAGALVLYALQRKLLYFPTPYSSVPGLEEIELSSDGVRLRGYRANPGRAHVLLYFGGNAEAVAASVANLAAQLPGITVIGFDYRGYGGSQGEPSERALYTDARAVYDSVKDAYQQISVLGRSLGSGVATYLASERPVTKLVLVTPFDSLAKVATSHYWYYPVRWLLKDKFNSVARAEKITAPTLILAAESDLVVPWRHTDELVKALVKCPSELVRIEGTGHNTIAGSPHYAARIGAFLGDSATDI